MTFREKSITRLYAFAMAAVFALVLAGCGGGGGGTATTPDPGTTPTPTPEEMCTDAGNVWSDGECITPAEHAFNMCVAGGGRDNGDGTCTSAADLAKVEAATKAAGTKEKAIAAEMAENTRTTNALNAGLGGTNVGTTPDDTSDDTAVATYSMTIERDRMGTTVKIADTALAGDDDPKFMQAMDLGGGRTMHARAMKADDDGNVVEEVVIVSTDIEAPTAVAFAKFEDSAGTTTQALDVTTNTENDAPTQTNEALNISNAITAHASVTVSAIKAAGFSASGSGPATYAGDDSDTADMDEAFETAGTYNGAMGTYRCNNVASGGGSCTVTYDSEGKIESIGVDWIFTPAADAMSDQPDYDYYHYGFWLKKTMDADGAVTYNEVETFAVSSVDASGALGTVLGSATYEGGAVGVYVKNVYNSDRTLNMATSGHFTADVSLMATFGQVPVSETDTTGTIAPNLLYTVSGIIDNFALSNDEENMWSVAVQGDIGDGTGADANASGTAKGGGDNDGNFSATFHGSVAADADGNIPKPGSVVGEFNASFTNGSVAGAFGARRQ